MTHWFGKPKDHLPKNKKSGRTASFHVFAITAASLALFMTSSAAHPVMWSATSSSGCPTQGQASDMTEVGGFVYILAGGGTGFYRFDPTTEACAAMATFPQSVTTNARLVAVDSDTIYGHYNSNVFKYDISENRWTAITRGLLDDGTPVDNSGATQNNGNSVVAYNNALYILAGAGATFQSYDPSTNTWTTRTSTPAAVNDGAAMTAVGSDIYAFRGAITNNFWRFNGTTWSSAIAQAPSTVEAGGALTTVGTTVYAFRGNNTRNFWSYDTVGNSWNTGLAQAPDYVFGGGALVAIGTDLYALQGNESRSFWKYNTGTNTWDASLSQLPSRVYGGGSLTTDGTNIYAFTGNQTKLYYKYTVATNSWTRLEDIPLAMGCDRTCAEGGTAYLNNVVYAVTGDGISSLGSSSVGVLWRYPLTGPNANTWPLEEKFSTPATATYGATMVHPGTSAQDPTGDFFYMLRGTVTASFWKFTHAYQSFIPYARSFYDAAETALISQDPPVTIAQGTGNKIVEVNGEIYMIPGGNSFTFVKYSPLDNRWTQLANTPDGIGESAVIVSTNNDTIWVTQSDDTFKYIISQDRWVARSNLGTDDAGTMYSIEASSGQSVGNRVVAANGKFFVSAGGGTTFLHFDPESNVWTTLTPVPSSAASGFSMVVVGTDIYALRGNVGNPFYKYDTNTNSWSILTGIPALPVPEEGADIAYPGSGDFIYALGGNNGSSFWRYSISGNSWTQLASTPAVVQGGGALEILGNFAYALRGQNTDDFWRYDITQTPGADAWNTGLDPADAPAAVRSGGALTTDGTYLYATKGGGTADFWRYDVIGDSWTRLINMPANMGQAADTSAYGGLTYDSISGDIFAVTGFGKNETPITPETGLIYRYKLSAGAGQNTWPYVKGIPFNPNNTFRGAGAAYPGTGDRFYLSTNNLFWDFDTSTEEWQTFDKAILDSGNTISQDGFDNEGRSTSIVYNGGVFYVIHGSNNAFQKYDPATNTWTRLADTPYPLGVLETDMMVDPNDPNKLLILNDAGNTLETEFWYSYDIPSDTWTALETVPMDPGCANMTYPGAGDWIYISACDSPAMRHSTWRYSMSKELWVTYDRARFDGYVSGNTNTNPTPVAETDPDQTGGTTIVDANSKLYVLNGGTSFQEFDPATNTWTVLTNPPVSVDRGALEWPGGEKLYAALNGSQNFYSYCLAGSVGCTPGTWTLEASSLPGIGDDGGEPTTWAGGADLYYPGTGDFIYAIIGRFSNDFFSFCFQNTGSGCTVGTWTKLGETPSAPAGFGGMASVDGNIIYALAGGFSQTFWSYNIGTGGWTNLGNLAPATANCGAALVEDGTYIYATRGNFTNDFWRYDPGAGSWSDAAVTDLPEEILVGDTSSGCHLGGITLIEGTNEIWATSGRGKSPNSFSNTSVQGHLYRYKIATDEWPHYAAVVDNNLGQSRPTALTASGLDNFLYLQPGQATTTFHRYTIEDKSGTPDRTAADPGPGTWTSMPSVPFAANGPLMKYANGFIYLMRGNFSKNFTRFDFSETNSATLIANEITSDNPATWAAITNGTFTITLNGSPYNILGTGGTGINFSGVTSMADVANVVQAAIRNETGSTETVTYCDDLGSFNDRGYFIFRSAIAPGGGGSVSTLGRYSALGTDISGVSVQGSPPVTLAGNTGQVRAETTAGDWEYCGATGQPDNIPVAIGDTSSGSRSGGMTYNPIDNELWVTHSSGDAGNVEGDNASLLWRYDVAANDWPYRPAVPDPPAAFNGGGDLTAHDADTLYALRGGNTTDFFEFDIPSNSWINLSSTAPAPGTVQAGGSLTSDGTTVYATRGNGTRDFWTFNPVTNTWNDGGTPTQPPFIMGSASSTSLGNIDYANNIIWAASGNGDNGIVDNTDALLHRYNTVTDEWPGITDPANPTAVTDWRGGTDLTSIGGSDLYALRGRSVITDPNFFHYDILTDTWTTLATLPFPAATVQITDGGNLEAAGSNTIYALRGFNTNTFYKYDVSGDAWSNDPTRDFPVNVGTTSEFADRGDLTYLSSNNVLYGIPGTSTIVYELRLANRATIEQINGGVDPVEDTPFDVIVQSSDTNGDPISVPQDTQITLSLETGTGTLGGTLIGTITNGTSQTTISGVTYSIPEVGVQIRATDTSVSPELESTVSDAFNVDAAPPTITTINPGIGTTMGGTAVTIIGTNFQATPTVTFGGISAPSVTFVNDTQITAVTPQTVPPATTGAVNVVVTNPDSQFDTELNGFTYAAPSVSSVVPNGGSSAGGNTVTVNGNYFGQAFFLQAVDIDNAGGALTDHQVEFSLNTANLISNGKMASDCSDLRVLDSNQSTSLPYWIEDGTCNTAATAVWTKLNLTAGPSTKTIYAQYTGNSSTTTQNCVNVFEFCDDFSGASIDAARWPTTQGLEGDEIADGVLTLENTEGLFAGNNALVDNNIIETRAAPGTTGRIGGAVRAATTTVAGFVGDGGSNILDILWWSSSVLYAETNTGETFFFSPYTTDFKTYFIEYRPGAVDTANFNYNNGQGTTTRTGTNASGTLFPVLFSSSGTGNAQWDYIFVRKSTSSQPSTTLAAETSGGITAEFELGNPSADVTYIDEQTLSAVVPSHAVGTVNVIVTNDDGLSGTLINGYTYATAPAVTAINPGTGNNTQTALTVTIGGADFAAGATARLEKTGETDISCTNIQNFTSTSFDCDLNLSAAATGAWDVVVENPDAQTGTLTNGFTVTLPPPTIISIVPDEGPLAGGTSVTITGENFVEGEFSRTVDISNSSASALTNYQVSFTLDTATPIGTGKMRNDCGDLRVKNTDGSRDIDYWIESNTCNTASTRVYAEVPNIAATPATTTIYITYGDDALTDASNIANTFIDELDSTNLQGHWQMDEIVENSCSGGEDGCDTSGNGRHATAGAGTTIATGKFNNGRNFNGTSVAFDIPTISIPTDISAGAWVRTSSWSQSGFIIQKRVVNTQWELFLEGGQLKWRGGSTTSVNCSTAGLTANTWYHMSATQQGTTARVYINGVECNNGTVTAIGNSTGQLDIGRHDSGFFFNGDIDEAFVYDRILSPGEINSLSTNYGFSTPNHPGSIFIRKWEPSGTPNLEAVSTAVSAETGGPGDITFDGISGTNIAFVNSTTLTADTPAHAAGPVDVVVTNPDSQFTTLSNGFSYLGVPDETTSTFTASAATVSADGVTESILTATIKDAGNSPLQGEAVTVAHTSGPGVPTIRAVNCLQSDLGSVTKGTTNANGQACFSVHSDDMTTPSADTFTATITSIPAAITQTANVEFTVDHPDLEDSTFESNPPAVTADGSTPSTLTATIVDSLARTIISETVNVSDNSGGNVTYSPLSQSENTNAGGIADFDVTSAATGTYTFTASLNAGYYDKQSYTETASPAFINDYQGTASALVVGSQGDNVEATSTLPFDFELYGTNTPAGNNIYLCSNGFISLASSGCPSSGSLTNAIAGFFRNLDTTSGGIYREVATDNNSVRFLWDAMDVGTSNPVFFEIILYRNNRVDFHYFVNSGLASRIGLFDATASASPDDASTFDNSIFGNREATRFTNTEVAPGAVNLPQTAQVEFQAGNVSVGNSTIAAIPSSVVADGTQASSITVTLRDAFNNPVSGRTVELSDDQAVGQIDYIGSPVPPPYPTDETDVNGEATFEVASTAVDTATFTAADITGAPLIIGSTQVDFTCILGPNQQCVLVSIEPSAGVLTITAPGNFSFQPAVTSGSPQDLFSINSLTPYTLNVDDLMVVTDTESNGGFNLQLQSSVFADPPLCDPPGPSCNQIPLTNFYVITQASNTGGQQISGVEYDAGYSGVTNISALQNNDTTGALDAAGTFTTNGDNLDSILDLMLAPVTVAEIGRNGQFKQNVQYYLQIPAFQTTGNYQVTLTFDLTRTAPI